MYLSDDVVFILQIALDKVEPNLSEGIKEKNYLPDELYKGHCLWKLFSLTKRYFL